MKLTTIIALVIVLFNLALWGGFIYLIMHFVMKVW